MTVAAVHGLDADSLSAASVQKSSALRFLRGVGVLLLYVLLALLEFRSAWVHPTSRIIGPGGDNLQAAWFLKWTSFALTHGHNPFYTTYLNYPKGANLMWNTSVPLLGFVLWPIIQLEGPIFAFNLALTLGVSLAAWCAYLAARSIGASTPGALVGGLLYGSCPFLTGQALGHLYLVFSITPPLILVLIVHSSRHKWRIIPLGICLGILFAAQLLISVEVLFTEGAAIVVAAALWYFFEGRRSGVDWRRAVGSTGLAALVFLLLDAIPLLELLAGSQQPSSPLHPPGSNPIDVTNLLIPTQMQWLNPFGTRITGHFIGYLAEWGGYLGVPILLLLVFFWHKSRSRLIMNILAVSGIVSVILALGPRVVVLGHVTSIRLPWAVLDKIPVLSNIVQSRLMMYADLCASLIVALGISEYLALYFRRPRATLARTVSVGGLVVLSVVSWLPARNYPAFVIGRDKAVQPPPFFTGRQVERIKQGSDVLVAPLSGGSHPGPQMWQLASNMRFAMPGGYVFISGPPGTVTPLPTPLATLMREVERSGATVMDARSRSLALRDIHRWRVSTVIVGPMPYERQMVSVFTSLLGRAPKFDEGVYVWWDVSVLAQKVPAPGGSSSVVPAGLPSVPPLPSTGHLAEALRSSVKDRDAWQVLSAVYDARHDLQASFPESSPYFDRRLLEWAVSYGVTIDSDERVLRPYKSQLIKLARLSGVGE
jgi:hypothetical protein